MNYKDFLSTPMEMTERQGRWSGSFVPTEIKEKIILQHKGRIGDIKLKQVQLERGSSFTDYVENSTEESMLGAAFRHIQDLKVYVTNEKGDMTRMFKEDLYSTLKIYQNIEEGTSSETLDSDRGLYRLIQNALNSRLSKFIQTDRQFSARVQSLGKGATFDVLDDRISLALFGKRGAFNQLSLGQRGIYLNGALIDLNGNARINEAFTNKLFSETITANNIRAMMGSFGSIVAANIDVNNLSGNKATFVKALFNGVYSSLKITGDNIDIVRNSGTISTRFTSNGLEIWRDGQHVGSVNSLNPVDTDGYYQGKKSMSLTVQPNSYLSLSYYDDAANVYMRALGLGNNGKIMLHTALYASDTDYGISLIKFLLGRSDGGHSYGLGIIPTEGTGGGIFFPASYGTYIRRGNGSWVCIDDVMQALESLNSQVKSLSQVTSSAPRYDGYTPPSSRPSARYHTVQRGDTCWGICRQYGISKQQFISWNGSSAWRNVIQPGERFRVG